MEKIQEFSEAGIIKNKEHLNPDGLGLEKILQLSCGSRLPVR